MLIFNIARVGLRDGGSGDSSHISVFRTTIS